jgi:hypothetical protein
MPRPMIVPFGADQTVYLVFDRLGVSGETAAERADLETVVADLLSGQFNDPVRVVAFNTLEHWLQDVSREIAVEIEARCDIEGTPVPGHIEDFVARHTAPARQFALRSA